MIIYTIKNKTKKIVSQQNLKLVININFYNNLKMSITLGDIEYPVAETAVFFVLILSLIFTIFLFRRGNNKYTIKYELMRNQQFFRRNVWAAYIIQGLYRFFFLLPFILLVTFAVLAGIRNAKKVPPIIINGLIILMILYPIKKQWFYWKMLLIWLLVLGSQLSTLFIHQINDLQAYYTLSATFYASNIVCFYLAIVSIEGVYWDLQEAVQAMREEVRVVNQKWAEGQIPKVFDGGLYGIFNKFKYPYLMYLILYFISLCFLIAYALLVYFILNSKLGFVGLISTIIYDLFVSVFNSLKIKGRTLKTIYPLIFVSRFLSFIFGLQSWLLGYCVLYFFVAVFIGWLIIDKHFPLVQKKKKGNNQQTKFTNAFRTPQFSLLILTAQIIIMILVEAYAFKEQDPTLNYNNVAIPIWQWGILAIIAAWVVNFYTLSLRILSRKKSKIFQLTQYYFGISTITQYHIYLSISYVLVIALGLYADLYLHQPLALICCIFLPLIYFCLSAFAVAWIDNNYDILANTDQYNEIMQKKYQAKVKKASMILQNQKLKGKKKQMMFSMKNSKNNIISTLKILQNKDNIKEENKQQVMYQTGEMSGVNINPLVSTQIDEKDIDLQKQIDQMVPPYATLKNWRNTDQPLSITQLWSNLTPNDKTILTCTLFFLLFCIGLCLASMLWGKSKLGISIVVCIISYLTLLPYYKFAKTKENMLIGEILGNVVGYLLGIVYWAVFDYQVVGPIAFSIGYIVIAVYCLIKCYKTALVEYITAILAIQILGCIVLIQATLAVHMNLVDAVVFGVIFFIFIVLQVPLYYILKHSYVPKIVIIICSVLIGATVITLSILGFIFGVLSSFAIFTIVLVMIFLAFFVTSLVFYLYKQSKHYENPVVYSAYGQPIYRFYSGKEQFKSDRIQYILFNFSMITIVVYSVIIAVFYDNKQWAIFGLSIFILIQFFVNIQISISSYLFIGVYKQKKVVTRSLILQAFNKLVNSYMAEQVSGQDSPFYKQKLEQARIKAKQTNDPEDWKMVVSNYDLVVKNLQEEQRFGFYWIAMIIFNLMAKKQLKIAKTLAELKSIEQQLNSSGIYIECLDQNLRPSQKYDKALQQIQNFSPVDYVIYEQILENYREEQKKKKKESQEIDKRQKQQNNKRNEEIYNEIKQKQKQYKSQKDKIAQFDQIKKRLNNKRFCDQQFPADDTILGDKLRHLQPSWRRPETSQTLTKDGITAEDVRQGQIGDCFLISSFAVLGEKRIKQALGQKNGVKQWINEKGAYMIKFFKFSKQIFVIIDDLLPVNKQDQFIFARSEQPLQFWPCILEKAYAKLYGGYHKIIGGKSHQVLSDFTGGFPSQILIEQYKSNPNGLWNQMITSIKNGYLLAAGTPPSKNGDRDFSKRKIVQGHAYSILQTKQIDEYRLIKLKNPQGTNGIQWIGPFSDKSNQMSKRMLGLLNHSKNNNDGIFWMTIDDFLIEFSSVYICSVFDEKDWKRFPPIFGQWNETNSFGTPNNIGCEKNPQFGIKVTKKCSFFVNLSQQPISALKGKNFIFMKALRNDGKRITPESVNADKSIGRTKSPTDTVSISLQLQLEANEYPYVFSLMVSCDKPGRVGKFTIQAYCNDKSCQIIQDAQFDRQK